jgi:hypothetical protein
MRLTWDKFNNFNVVKNHKSKRFYEIDSGLNLITLMQLKISITRHPLKLEKKSSDLES